MKYIVETVSIHRHVHIVEAEDESEAMKIAEHADDNWQEYLGSIKVDVNEFTEEQIAHFRKKEFFWEGTAYRTESGGIDYTRPEIKF